MVRMNSHTARGHDLYQALQELDAATVHADESARVVFVFYTARLDGRVIHTYLRRRFPYAALIGGTSHKGILCNDGIMDGNVIGLLAIYDDAGDYGVAIGPLGRDPTASAQKLLHKALARANCPGQIPELIWVYQAPGMEEQVIAGLRSVIGERCPILGGSAADDEIKNRWQQMGPDGVLENGLAVAVLFPSGGIGFALQGGCEPTGLHGIVTTAIGQKILAIDNLPAASVYNRWLDNRLDPYIRQGGNIAPYTALCPLGIKIGNIDQVPHYQLAYPYAITPPGTLHLFSSLPEGTRIYAMSGNENRLVQRAKRIATQALADLPGGPDTLAGCLVTSCAGFRIAMDECVGDMASEIKCSLNNAPLMGCFTFGEQGYLLDRNMHVNLMISAIAFGR